MLIAFQHSQACSCHLPLSLQSFPLQPSCSQQSCLFPLSWDQGKERAVILMLGPGPGAGSAQGPCWEIDGLGGEGNPATSFNCFFMSSPSKPMAGSSSVFTGSHLVTFLGSISIPHCGLTGFGGLTNCKSICLHDCTVYSQY